jgi:hypothetical protein
MSDLLLNPIAAGLGIRERNTARTDLCTYPRTGLRRGISSQTTEPESKELTVDNEHEAELLEDRRISTYGEFLCRVILLLNHRTFIYSSF